MTTIDRRTLIVGTAGLFVLAACGGKEGGNVGDNDGPNIVQPKTGNLVTPEDAQALAEKLNTATEASDLDAFLGLVADQDLTDDKVRARWERRFDNFSRIGVVTGHWFVGQPEGRTRNASGGEIEYDGSLVFGHRIDGCDAVDVVEAFNATFRKVDESAELELTYVGETAQMYNRDPAFWDVAEIDVIETDHAVIGFRTSDAGRAEAFADRIETGASRAFDVMPTPRDVSKVFYALTWPEIDGKLWGGVAVGDADAHAYYHSFLDPAQLANGQQVSADSSGLPLGTGRVGLHSSVFDRPDFVNVATHEGIHVLANQWLDPAGDPPTWVIEGLATWGAEGGDAVLARDGGRIRQWFAQFQSSVALENRDVFHGSPRRYENYMCSAAVIAYLEDEKGRDAVFELAEAFYSTAPRDEAAKKFGTSEEDLLAATRSWLGV